MLCWSGYEDHKNGYQTRKSTNIRNICVSIQLICICELIADAENYVKRFIIAWYKSCIFSWSVIFHSMIYINNFFPTHPGSFHQGLFGTLCLSFSRSASIAFTISSKKKQVKKPKSDLSSMMMVKQSHAPPPNGLRELNFTGRVQMCALRQKCF